MGNGKEPIIESEWQDEDSELEPSEGELDVSSPELLETDEQGGVFVTDEVDEQQDDDDDDADSNFPESERLQEVDIASLGKNLQKKRKRSEEIVKPAVPTSKPDLDILRSEILGLLGGSKNKISQFDEDDEEDEEEVDDESASDEDDYDQDDQPARKRSKHAPISMSSKHAVSRKRNVIPLSKSLTRDPRFDPTSGPVDHDKVRKRYAFLDDYVEDEIKSLKSAIKQQKPKKIRTEEGKYKNAKRPKGVAKLPEEDIEAMKKELVKLESKRATQQARDREQDVQREHKKKEMEMVKQGKKPFFLKKSEVKKQVLVKRYEGMSQGRREKTMEKKRRKLAGKERREMPGERRNFG